MLSNELEFESSRPAIEGFSFPTQTAALYVRLYEIAFSLLALGILWPLIVIQWIWIRIGTPGPGLFFQDRVGINAVPFKFVKLRTMYVDARQRWPQLYAYRYTADDLEHLRFKVERDPRVTPQGSLLRKISIDELPNFWNVIKGDMALVGPRPEIPEMLPYYTAEMMLKFSVRPGVTGLAQVSGRGRLSFFRTVELDCEYVRTRSLALDLQIIWKTVMMILVRDGAF
jgi:lipopolysaccharide/colanic/teichoic acid biosynthesis glycosyltransferase